jgi:hypothetical protein
MTFLFCAGVKDRGFSRHIGTSRCRKPERAARRQGHGAHADATASVPASVLLQQLHDEAPKDHFSLGWLMSRMHKRSFGLIMLLLAVIAIAPGVSIVAGLLLMIPTLQMIAGQNMPVFPSRIRRPSDADATPCSLGAASSTRAQVSREAHSSALATPLDATKRVVGAIVAVLSIALVITPVPFCNVVPAVVIGLISLTYLKGDGLLLSIALLAGVIVLAVDGSLGTRSSARNGSSASGNSSAERKPRGEMAGVPSR